MSTGTFEAFSVSHAAVLDGEESAAQTDIYGVREGSLEVDTGNYDNTGDDAVLSSWEWFNFANITVTSGYIGFSLLSRLTGSTVNSNSSGDADDWNILLWEDRSLNVRPAPMLIRCPSKDSDGVPRDMFVVLFKVQFGPLRFQGPSYREGTAFSFAGKGLMSDKDEKGVPLGTRENGEPIKSIGRIVNVYQGKAYDTGL